MEPIYIYSFDEAMRNNELMLYNNSYLENISCADAIKTGIAQNFDGYRLNTDFVKKVVNDYGYDRVMFVLANTIQHFDYDGRISSDNKKWAQSFFIPDDKKRVHYLIENSGLVNIVANKVRKLYDGLNLWDERHCETNVDLTGKIAVLKPERLKDEYKNPDFQLFYCNSGFGCYPTARGRAIFGEFIKDGRNARFDREDFIGLLKPEYLPEAAKKFLANKEKPSIKAQLDAAPKQKSISPQKAHNMEL